MLFQLSEAAHREFLRGVRKLKEGDFPEALAAFQFSHRIRKSEEAKKGIAVAMLGTGRFENAVRQYFLSRQPATPYK